MQCLSLTSYQQARDLCAARRFATKGRRLDNYTRIRLIPAQGAHPERLEISDGGKRPTATLHPHNFVEIPRIEDFTAHTMWWFFGLSLDRDKKGYKYACDVLGTRFLVDAPIYGRFEAGRLLLVDGKPVPTLTKDADASLQWRRDKQAMDRVFLTCCKLHAFSEYTSAEVRSELRQRDLPDWASGILGFVRLVQAKDADGMAKFLAAHVLRAWASYQPDTIHVALKLAYQSFYASKRRDILVAAGARLET